MNNKKVGLLLLFALCIAVSGCGNGKSTDAAASDQTETKTAETEAADKDTAKTEAEETETEKSSLYFTPEVSDGQLVIEKTLLSEEPVFVNYDSDGTWIQLIAVIASDGTYRLSLNTCQSCSPSPAAYFTFQNGKMVCRNCGSAFTTDDVGSSAMGCNPMNIEYAEEEDRIVVDTALLDEYSVRFEKWGGPLEI